MKSHNGLRQLYFFMTLVVVILCGCATPNALKGEMATCDPSIDQAVQSGDWSKALQAHQNLLARSPSNCRAMYHLGYIWGHMGDRRQEVHYYHMALACGYTRDDQLYFNLGMAQANLGDFDSALNAFEQAVAEGPKRADNFFGMGLIYQATERWDEAERAWLRAVALDHRHIESHLALARLYLEHSRWDAARHHLDAVQRAAPENREARRLRDVLQSRQALEY